MTLACEDAVVTVAYVDAKKCVDVRLLEILKMKLKFGHKAKFCADFEHKVRSRV